MCSHNPSDANTINLSSGFNSLLYKDGPSPKTGRWIGSRRWNRGKDESRANSGFFKYASPIVLET